MPFKGNAQKLQSGLNNGGQGNHGGCSNETIEAEMMEPGSLEFPVNQVRSPFTVDRTDVTRPTSSPNEPRAHAAEKA